MRISDHLQRVWQTLLKRLVELLTGNWVALLLEILRWSTRQYATRGDGLYEILSYESTLDLYEPNGERASVRKQQRVRFLQNDITAFEDIVYGEGNIMAEYAIAPGRPVDFYRDGDRWHILVSLRATKNRGDVTAFTVERQIEKGFMQDEEWWQIELRHPTQQIRLTVLFPPERHCRKATLKRRSTHQVTELGSDDFHEEPGGRQRLVWECRAVRPLEIFTLRWSW